MAARDYPVRPAARRPPVASLVVKWAETIRVRMDTTWRLLIKELSAFGVVGATCFAIDVVLFQLLYAHAGFGAVTAKFFATMVSMTVAYFAHRYWSFSHRARTGVRREYLLFAVVNGARCCSISAWSPSSGTPWARRARSCCSWPTSPGLRPARSSAICPTAGGSFLPRRRSQGYKIAPPSGDPLASTRTDAVGVVC